MPHANMLTKVTVTVVVVVDVVCEVLVREVEVLILAASIRSCMD